MFNCFLTGRCKCTIITEWLFLKHKQVSILQILHPVEDQDCLIWSHLTIFLFCFIHYCWNTNLVVYDHIESINTTRKAVIDWFILFTIKQNLPFRTTVVISDYIQDGQPPTKIWWSDDIRSRIGWFFITIWNKIIII